MTARQTALLALTAALGFLALGGPLDALPDLAPVLPEVDGVHPLRAAVALRTAYGPGEGFRDKYPPLGTVLMGLAGALGDPGLGREVPDLTSLTGAERRRVLWPFRDRIRGQLRWLRGLSRLAMAGAVALAVLLAAEMVLRAGGPLPLALAAAAVVLLTFGRSFPVRFYAGTTNVDALALLGSLGALWLALRCRWTLAAVLAGLSMAVKDPCFVLAPVVLGAALADPGPGRWRRVLVSAVVLGLVYLLGAGALTAPAVWWDHLCYLVTGGVEGVGRIDAGDPLQWARLGAHSARLAGGSLGWATCAAGGVGLAWWWRAQPVPAALLGGALLATMVLFVAPVGFVYLRFLLVPLAVLAVGAGLLVARVAGLLGERCRASRAAAVRVGAAGTLVLAAAWLTPSGGLPGDEIAPRLAAARAVAEQVPDGARLVFFADERWHGPPLDPGRIRWTALGLDAVPERLQAWRRSTVQQRPEFLLSMAFPTDPPSGAAAGPRTVPSAGDRVAGLYEVLGVWGRPSRAAAERALALRPTLTLMRRLGP